MNKPLRILAADHHAIVRAGYRAILEAQPGWTVCGEAGDGEEAIALAGELKPDVLIMDFEMPVMSGVDATQAIHEMLPGMPILVVSLNETPAIIEEAVAAGACGYLPKTETPRMLVAAVESLTQGKTFFTSATARLGSRTGPVKADAPPQISPRLTPREREVTALVASGCTSKDVAQRLGISVKTAEVHRTNIMRRMNSTPSPSLSATPSASGSFPCEPGRKS